MVDHAGVLQFAVSMALSRSRILLVDPAARSKIARRKIKRLDASRWSKFRRKRPILGECDNAMIGVVFRTDSPIKPRHFGLVTVRSNVAILWLRAARRPDGLTNNSMVDQSDHMFNPNGRIRLDDGAAQDEDETQGDAQD